MSSPIVCIALGESDLAPQLRVLDLSLGALTDLGAAALMEFRSAFANLAVLDVRHHRFLDDWPLNELAKFVDWGLPHSDDEDDDEETRPRVWLDT